MQVNCIYPTRAYYTIMNIKIAWAFAAILAVAGYIATSAILHRPSPAQQPSKLQIVASFYPMAFFAQQIAGDNAVITNITPAGAEPHDYEPSTQQIAQMERANLVILNGNVEPWANKIKANIQNSSTKIISVSDSIATNKDPHVWLDPVLAKQEVQHISNAIIAINPTNADQYKQNTTSLLTKLDQLDSAYKTGLAQCSTKDIVTSHDAFSYLAQQYGLHQVPIAGLSPDEEPSTQALIATAKLVQEKNIQYIFFESLVSPKLAQTIATETHTQALELNPLEGLTTDQQQGGEDYFTVMYNNLHNLQLALSCTK